MKISEESEGFKSMEKNANLLAELLLSLVVALNSVMVFCIFHQDQFTVHINIKWSRQNRLTDNRHRKIAWGCLWMQVWGSQLVGAYIC